ncbi:MAG: hypothetical protein LC803_18665 [Acidobacteria bacterium]|nr:hypothetical protein [Acidobacteriota bacterium]
MSKIDGAFNSQVRPVALVMLLTLLAGSLPLLYTLQPRTSANTAGEPGAGVTPFDGGTFEASGVAHVRGTDGVLFVDDGRTDEVFWMRLGEGRRQAGEFHRKIKPEGVTRFASGGPDFTFIVFDTGGYTTTD